MLREKQRGDEAKLEVFLFLFLDFSRISSDFYNISLFIQSDRILDSRREFLETVSRNPYEDFEESDTRNDGLSRTWSREISDANRGTLHPTSAPEIIGVGG